MSKAIQGVWTAPPRESLTEGFGMRQSRGQVVLLIAFLSAVTSRPAYPAGSSCSTTDSSATFSTTLSLPPTAKTPFAEARAAIAQGHLNQARSLLVQTPSGADRFLWEGVLLLHSGKPFSAIRSLEKAARLEDSSTIETLLGVAYLLLNQRQLTSKAVARALELDPGNMRTLYLRGRYNFVIHNFSQAEQDFRAVLKTEPHDYRTLFYLGYGEWRLGKQDPALEHLQRSVEVIKCCHLSFALAPQTLAEFQLETGNPKEAIANSDLVVSLASKTKGEGDDQEEVASSLVLRGKAYSALGNVERAVDNWRRAVELDPDLAEAWYLLAHVYQRRGETKMAAESLDHFKRVHDEL